MCQLQWLVYGVFNSWAQWSYCHFQPKWCHDCMNWILMKNKTKPQGLEEWCSVCVAASGGRFPSQLYKCCLCGLSWRRQTQAGCLCFPVQQEHWVTAQRPGWRVPEPGRQQTPGLKLLWGGMFTTHPCLFVVCGCFTDRVAVLDRAVTQRSWEV